MKITTDLTKYQAKSIGLWQFDMDELRNIEPKDDIAKAALNKFINRKPGQPIDVHRTNGRRIFNPFTAMKRSHRKYVSYNGALMIEIDAANSHPLIMVYKMIKEGLPVEQDLKVAVESGTFYDYLIEDGKNRHETKELWFSFCYAKKLNINHPIYKKLNSLFPLFIESFARYSKGRNLSEYLQELESRIWVDKISMALMRAEVNHVTIHDSVVFSGVQNVNKVLDIIQAAFDDIDPPLHVEYLNGDELSFKRVKNIDNEKYLSPDYKLLEELQACKADPWLNISKPETAVYMYDGEKEFPLLTTGNFSAISGKSKSGKTLLISAIVASVITSSKVLTKFRGDLPSDKSNIVYIDTEMAEYDLQWVMKRILQLSGIDSKQKLPIDFYRLREKSTEKRTELIDLAIRTSKNVGLVVIDGIRDIVKDINNPEESTIAINNIMRWTDVYKLHLIAVLHQNPGKESGNKLRGHIGTEAMNKAEAVISVLKSDQGDYSMVNSDFMRRQNFKSFGIQYDEATNLPVIIGEIEDPLIKVVEPWDLTPDQHAIILDKLFSIENKHTKMNFISKGRNLMLILKYDISRRAFDKLYNHWIDEKIIQETREHKTKYISKYHDEIPAF